jgi:outer membrane protein assembly factor BamA
LDQKPLGIASILFFLVSLTLVAFDSKAAPGAGPGAGGLVQLDTSIEERFKNLDGKIVADVDILGLVRTKGQAVHWLMKTNSGKVFSSHQLAVDIQTLYNTANLYDINVQAGALADGRVLVRVGF